MSCFFLILCSLAVISSSFFFFFFFNDTATTEIYTLSLHDALPISSNHGWKSLLAIIAGHNCWRSEEHTSELQSRGHLVCRLLLEKKKKTHYTSSLVKKKKKKKQKTKKIQQKQ